MEGIIITVHTLTDELLGERDGISDESFEALLDLIEEVYGSDGQREVRRVESRVVRRDGRVSYP